MRTTAFTLLVWCTVPALATPAGAQQLDSARVGAALGAALGDVATATPRFAAALAKLPSNTEVRFSTDGVRHHGRFVSAANGVLAVHDGNRARIVPLARVDTLWRRGHAVEEAAVVGFLLFGAAMQDTPYSCGSRRSVAGCRAEAFVMGGFVGAGLFALIGAVSKTWERVHPDEGTWLQRWLRA